MAERGREDYKRGMLQPGEYLDGYRVIRLIGSGGFGAVWLCQSEALGDYRALKFIPDIDPGRIQKEFEALCRYRTAAGQLRYPSIMPIEHVNRRSDGLYYIMPLADGHGSPDPLEAAWCPLTLAAVMDRRREEPAWFTSEEINGYITPILHALQLLSDVGLVHRDVKPDNILFLNGTPCLGDISLLGEDSHNITRCGTPGYSAPSWFLESGGQPDMFGAATTLYSLLTGNPPDKMGRAAFRWPPQGENSLSDADRQQWLRIHGIIRRAVDERPAQRFLDYSGFLESLLLRGTHSSEESQSVSDRQAAEEQRHALLLIEKQRFSDQMDREARETVVIRVEVPSRARLFDFMQPVLKWRRLFEGMNTSYAGKTLRMVLLTLGCGTIASLLLLIGNINVNRVAFGLTLIPFLGSLHYLTKKDKSYAETLPPLEREQFVVADKIFFTVSFVAMVIWIPWTIQHEGFTPSNSRVLVVLGIAVIYWLAKRRGKKKEALKLPVDTQGSP